MTRAKQRRLARELDTRVRYLRLAGMDSMTLFAAMSDRLPDFKALLDAAGLEGMNGFARRLPDLRRYAGLLTGVAQGIQDGTIEMPEWMATGAPLRRKHACTLPATGPTYSHVPD